MDIDMKNKIDEFFKVVHGAYYARFCAEYQPMSCYEDFKAVQ